jgi:choline dehydrogenase-like flavoprotein
MRAVPQGYAIEEFKDEGILMEGVFTPVELMSLEMGLMGEPLVDLIGAYNHLAAFGVMVKDRPVGRVSLGLDGKPRIKYQLGRPEVAKLKRGVVALLEVFLQAGAKRLFTPIYGHETLNSGHDLDRLRDARLSASDFELSAYHPLGTARMAARGKDGVVDSDHEVYGVARLHVVDGSVVPGSLGVNPQITIMALATRAADRIYSLLKRDSA